MQVAIGAARPEIARRQAQGPFTPILKPARIGIVSASDSGDCMDQGDDSATTAAIHRLRPRGEPLPAPPNTRSEPLVTFNREELRAILNLYGRRVAEGEWRDYAIAFAADKATFSIYRRASEMPLYRIEKNPTLARKQGAYAVVAATGLILKRGHDLARVISAIDSKPKLVVV